MASANSSLAAAVAVRVKNMLPTHRSARGSLRVELIVLVAALHRMDADNYIRFEEAVLRRKAGARAHIRVASMMAASR